MIDTEYWFLKHALISIKKNIIRKKYFCDGYSY